MCFCSVGVGGGWTVSMEKHLFFLLFHFAHIGESSRDTMNSCRREWQKWTMEQGMKEEEKGEMVALIDCFN